MAKNSKTVQTVFPIGGDSRKQMYAIFVMALVGCVVFTIYASQLFFRHKSRQLGPAVGDCVQHYHIKPCKYGHI